MRASKIFFIFYLINLFIVLTHSPIRAEITNRIVAIVNSDIITLYDLNTSLKNFTNLSPNELKQKNESDYYDIRRAVLDTLINETITGQQINKLGIKVDNKDINDAIEKIKSDGKVTQEELIYSLKAEGITLEDYREKIKKQIELSRLVNYEVKSKIVVSEKEMKDYYNKHTEGYYKEDRVSLARIFLGIKNPDDSKEVAKVKKLGDYILGELNRGSEFSEMAKKYSQGPAASEGGKLGWIKLNSLEINLRKKISILSKGEISGLDRFSSGFQIIKIVDKQKRGIRPFEEVKGSIHSKLFQEKVEKRYASWLKKLREESFINIIF